MVTESDTSKDWVWSFLGITCPYAQIISLLFAILVVFTLLTMLSMYLLSPPHPSYYIATITTAMNGVLIIVFGVVLYFCRRFNLRTS